ncbi:MAG: hypothetical protein PF636_10780, partial [Actinomycetota bacterium]|nr:hypothetical protein [Actinomycetota bacterium]
MATQDVKRIIRREGQLNLLAYTIIIVLLGISGLLAFAIMIGLDIPEFWLFGDRVVQTIFMGLMLMVVLYMVDQHRRLRSQLVNAHEGLESANAEIAQAYNRLEFAQCAAETMTSIEESSALESVLRESVFHFGAHAAAVVGEDITIFTDEDTDISVAQAAVLQVALDAVRAGKPLTISNHKSGSEALAVPLRIHGELKSVVCLWRQGEPFDSDQLEGH